RRSSPRTASNRRPVVRHSHQGIFGGISTRSENARNRLHVFGSDYGGVGEGGGAAPCNRGCEKICLVGHSVALRLEIWAREDFRAQPVSITNTTPPASLRHPESRRQSGIFETDGASSSRESSFPVCPAQDN